MTLGKVTIERGSLSFQMTAQDLITTAVNVVQNGQPLDEWCPESADKQGALREMLDEVYHQLIASNRQAALRLAARRGDELPA